ncbi:MAG: pirin family protein [Actinomycetota bacterium]
MADLVLQTVPLGTQWPTLDPFLFCVHHDDAYPAGDGRLAPAASLAGRQIGSDFSYQDGWSMYHGSSVPGFPSHPHRGFETITYVRRGLVDHADSLGAAARYGRGDTQWLTAGGGIVHAEMFPLLDTEAPNPLELFQIWLNLPAADKMVDAHFSMLWDADTPRVRADGVEVTVVAGAIGDHLPAPPPPSSYASRPDADVAVWHVRLDDGAEWSLPPASGPETARTLYHFAGSRLTVGGVDVDARTGVVVRSEVELPLLGGPGGSEVLVLQGRPIGEPVAQYGPFVMNDRAGIQQAFEDYQRTEFGGWPWDRSDPTHGDEPRRFARRADGSVEEAPLA